MILRSLVGVFIATGIAAASPLARNGQLVLNSDSTTGSKPRPLVIWHGLGDTALSDGISQFIEDIEATYPGIFVHSVKIPTNGSADDERKAGFWGDADAQAQEGCEQLSVIPELSGGFDAMGFSQGGLFLRYYAQYCNDPPVRNLMTFGTPHYGIAALIPCPTPPTVSCLLAARAARAGIYSSWAQTHLVQAAYFRDPARLEEFFEINTFLRNLNGEGGASPDASAENDLGGGSLTRGSGGGRGLGGLENMIAMMFDQDRTVSPAQSAHFATYSSENKTLLIPLEEQELYKQDWIGLRKLDEKDKLHLLHCPGEHMDLGAGDCAVNVVKDWVGRPED